jgi:hypothetical protein
MRADEGYSCPTCGTREQVRDSRVDHRSACFSGIVRSFAGPLDWVLLPWGNVLANAPVFGRSRPGLWRGGVRI